MKKLLLAILLLPILAISQTAQLNFVYKNGQTVGRSVVMDLPTSIFTYSVPQGQLLVFYPPAYKAGKTCGLIIWNAGDGEQVGLDVTLVNKNSLTRMIAAGLTPYSILPNKDTLFWVVASVHNNAGSAYRSQLKQILPWVLDKSGIRFDPAHVGVSGLSGGGSATWAAVMTDTAVAARITWIASLANGGYDDKLPALRSNLIYWLQHGGSAYPYIGTQDPGYNGVGFFAYDSVCKKYALPDHYHPHIIPNGTHSANVWDVPWNSRVIWDSLGAIGYTAPPVIPHVKAILRVDSTEIHYPTTWFTIADSSQNSYGGTWDILDGPNRPIITGMGIGKAKYSGLVPGIYTVGIHVYGDGNTAANTWNADSAFVRVTVYGPPECPVCPICPVCPPRRKAIGFTIDALTGLFKFTYDDGNP